MPRARRKDATSAPSPAGEGLAELLGRAVWLVDACRTLAKPQNLQDLAEWLDYFIWLAPGLRPESSRDEDFDLRALDIELEHELREMLQRWWREDLLQGEDATPSKTFGALPHARFALRMWRAAQAACERDIITGICFDHSLIAIGEADYPGGELMLIPASAAGHLKRAPDRPNVLIPSALEPLPKERSYFNVRVVRRDAGVATALRRGRPSTVMARIIAAMRNDLKSGLTAEELRTMAEKAMASRYDASRDTCRKARGAVLSEPVEN